LSRGKGIVFSSVLVIRKRFEDLIETQGFVVIVESHNEVGCLDLVGLVNPNPLDEFWEEWKGEMSSVKKVDDFLRSEWE